MEHVLARAAALDASRFKTLAEANYNATAHAFGIKDAHHGLNAFIQRMDAIIAKAGPKEERDPNAPTDEEIAFFERMERIALANQKR